MTLLSFTTPADLTRELGLLNGTAPYLREYEEKTTRTSYYLWIVDGKIKTLSGECVLETWKKVSLLQLSKLGCSIFPKLDNAQLVQFVYFFTLMREHFAEKNGEGLLNTISFLDQANRRLKLPQKAPKTS